MDLQTRNQYMKAMGIPVWLPRPHNSETDSTVTTESQAENNLLPIVDEPPANLKDIQHQSANGRVSLTAILSDTAHAPDKQSGTSTPPDHVTAKSSAPAVEVADCSTMDWATLQGTVKDCQRCILHKSRTQTVFGTGDTNADWMIVGEAPGANEDRQGEPFVGRAGQLLNNMLAAVGLPRNAVYISNVLKCRPPNNRDPKPEESALCRGYLERQIGLIQPKLIIVVGRIAAHNLLQVNTPLGRLRGTPHALPGSDIPVIVTYHPAYLLRQPAEKRKAWQDLQLARRIMRES